MTNNLNTNHNEHDEHNENKARNFAQQARSGWGGQETKFFVVTVVLVVVNCS